MENNNKCVGILTYHSAYNYGSVLQAYATQRFLESSFPNVDFEIINYRMKEQRAYYSLIRTKYGVKTLLRDLMQLPVYSKRKKRVEKFETFIADRIKLSPECIEPESVYSLWSKYQVIISGSDQIWNKHSCELHRNDWKYLFPYVLRGYDGKKISYASSFGNMEDDEKDIILEDIRKFENISLRERYSIPYLESKLQHKINKVSDPTFLMTKEEWITALSLSKRDNNYILYYSLGRDAKIARKNLSEVIKFARRRGYLLKVITPYMYLYENVHKDVINCADMGPIDFLNAIYGAEVVITDSFHGTALSINFHKDLYVIEITNGKDLRTTSLMNDLGVSRRLISNIEDLNGTKQLNINYNVVENKVAQMRNESKAYLVNSISQAFRD